MSILREHPPTAGAAAAMFVAALLRWLHSQLDAIIAYGVPDDVAHSGFWLVVAGVVAGIGWLVERYTIPFLEDEDGDLEVDLVLQYLDELRAGMDMDAPMPKPANDVDAEPGDDIDLHDNPDVDPEPDGDDGIGDDEAPAGSYGSA